MYCQTDGFSFGNGEDDPQWKEIPQAEAQLIQSIEEECEARARRHQKRKDKKERRSHSSTQPANPTVILVNYQPPQEPSDEEGESVTRRLDFDGGPRAISVRDPDTPEELRQQPNQPSSPRATSPPLDLEDSGYDPGPQPVDADATEGAEEQNQPTEGDGQAEQEAEQSPPDGEQLAGDGEQGTGEGQDSSRQPTDPPDPPEPPEDPDNPDPLPDPEEDEEEEEEDEGDQQEEVQQEGEEEEDTGEGNEEEQLEEQEEEDPLQMVESDSTKKSRKNKERKEKVDQAALTRLPYPLAEKGPLYKGTTITAKDSPRRSRQWVPRKGSPTQVKDNTPINHAGNRSFENIRDHQISSIFTLQKHLADCNKGSKERNSTPDPLRTNTGEFSPCRTEMVVIQSDDGTWGYEYSELPGLVPMSYGMKTFDIMQPGTGFILPH